MNALGTPNIVIAKIGCRIGGGVDQDRKISSRQRAIGYLWRHNAISIGGQLVGMTSRFNLQLRPVYTIEGRSDLTLVAIVGPGMEMTGGAGLDAVAAHLHIPEERFP